MAEQKLIWGTHTQDTPSFVTECDLQYHCRHTDNHLVGN